MKDIIGKVASPGVVMGASLATAGVLAARKHFDTAGQFAAAVPLACGIGKIVKYAVDEHRPRLFVKSPEQSFPSGHSVAMTALGVSVAAASRRWWTLPLVAGAIAAINVSRVREREHWPKDVLVGDLVGVAGALAGVGVAYAIRRAIDNRRRARS